MIYLYHHNNQWMCFEGELPVKPNSYDYPTEGWKAHEENAAWEKYNQAIATLKSKALPVRNYGEIYSIANDNLDLEIKLPCIEVDGIGEVFLWPGTVIVDKCWQPESYTLYLPKPDMRTKTTKRILDETTQEVRDEVKALSERKEKAFREAWNAAIDACIKFISDNDSFIKSELEELKK